MNFWYFKSEPNCWSWTQQTARGTTGEAWTGVRNYAARNNLRAMAVGDRGLFYHSNLGKEFVGIVKVIRAAYPDTTTPGDDRWSAVDVRAFAPLAQPVTLAVVKNAVMLADMTFLRQGRLSVGPIAPEHFYKILELSGTKMSAV